MFLPSWLFLHCCNLLHLPYFNIRMEWLLAWKCFSPKRPSFTQRTTRPFSMMSSSTRLPTMETLPLPAKASPLTHPVLTPPLIPFPDHPIHLRHPRFLSQTNPPNRPRNRWEGGTLHLAGTAHPVAIHHQVATQLPGVILPLSAVCLPTTLPLISGACPPAHPLPLSYAGPEVGLRIRKLRPQRLGESTMEDTSAHSHHHHILPSLLHHHPGGSTARSVPDPCHHSPDQAFAQSSPLNVQTSVMIYSVQWSVSIMSLTFFFFKLAIYSFFIHLSIFAPCFPTFIPLG